MNREEFRVVFQRLTRARGTDYVALRERLVAGGVRIIPWLAREAASGDALRLLDATIVQTWIEHPRHVRLCDGFLFREWDPPRVFGNTDEDNRVRVLVGVGRILTPRLLEGLIRTEQYVGVQRYLALRTLFGLADPRSQEPLRMAMGDPRLPLDLRTEIAEWVLWSAFRDPRTIVFAEAIARDDAAPPGPRAWAISFLAAGDERQVLLIIHRLLEHPQGLDAVVALSCVDAIETLRYEDGAMHLEGLLIRRALPDDVREAMPAVIAEVRGVAALPLLQRVAVEDPSEHVRSAAQEEVDDLVRMLRLAPSIP